MKNDLHKTFGQIFDDDIEAFRSELIRVQHHQANRKGAEEWVKHLRFLDISKVPNLQEGFRRTTRFSNSNSRSTEAKDVRPELVIPITEQNHDDGQVPYIAVSWKWDSQHSSNNLQRRLFRYKIQRPGAAAHKSEFPDEYLERVIWFAQNKEITKLWIDKECIYQKEEDRVQYPKDKDLGVQIMDVVYSASTASVGLSTTPLLLQDEIDILNSLVKRTMFYMADDTDDPQFSAHKIDIPKVQMLILKILRDERWSRGWIFQEDHLASSDMTLLVPYSDDRETGYNYDFGVIPGDLQVNVKRFREAVTMFCLASEEDEKSWPTSEILSKAKQYKIWNKRAYTHPDKRRRGRFVQVWSDEGREDDVSGAQINFSGDYQDVNFFPTMTNSVLADICSRSVENDEDRIAILANALKFSHRLDSSPASPIVKTGGYSLSVAMLAQILINGEILRNNECGFQPSVEVLMKQTLQSYLSRCEYHFNAPSFKFEQSFIQRCRFRRPLITRRGVETKGFLFKILPYKADLVSASLRHDHDDRAKLRDTSRNPHARSIPKGRKLNMVAHQAIHVLANKLDRLWPPCRLASYLREYLQHDVDQAQGAPRSTSYVLDMISAIYQALRDGRDLSLARPACEPDSADPTAIFIDPPRTGWQTKHLTSPQGISSAQETLVFTSWDAPRGDYDRERIACLEVAMFDEDGVRIPSAEYHDGCFLRSYGWVNGVCNFRGQELETYCFPLPGITEGPCLSKSKSGTKRKRAIDDDSDSNGEGNGN